MQPSNVRKTLTIGFKIEIRLWNDTFPPFLGLQLPKQKDIYIFVDINPKLMYQF